MITISNSTDFLLGGMEMKIEGYFGNIKNANDTIKKLNESGFKNTFLDLNEHYTKNRNVRRNMAGTENSSSLSDLVLESGSNSFIDRTKAPLAAANPSVSGMGNMEEITDINCKVVVDVNDNNVDKAKQIIKEMGGDIGNPNLKEPEIVGNEEAIYEMQLDKLRRNFK
ncbi:MAG: hypothetical protein PWQ37_1694 [Candidatus Petromonas sp.]|jgi:hypothetical protein|nr:hypothetical protein [Candidatus Petromonas sp.]